MSEGDPHQHQAAKGIEFFYSLLHRFGFDMGARLRDEAETNAAVRRK